MKLAVVALTRCGAEIAARIADRLSPADLYLHERWTDSYLSAIAFKTPLRELVAELFPRYRGIVFVMATGIVVRVLAPYLRDKSSDPAVVVVDEGGAFAISLVAGHLGGGNQLAREVASCLGAIPVITTASDAKGYPALDLLARELGCSVEPADGLKKVMAHLVNGGRVRFFSELPLPPGNRLESACAAGSAAGVCMEPEGRLMLDSCEAEEAAVLLTSRLLSIPLRTPYAILRPRHLVMGVGCGRGVAVDEVLAAILRGLELAGRALASLAALATVSVKGREEGLRCAAEMLGVPLRLIDLEAISSIEGKFEPSEFVRKAVGVGGVCEPAAMLAAGAGDLLLKKTAVGRVTVALAAVRYGWWESALGTEST